MFLSSTAYNSDRTKKCPYQNIVVRSNLNPCVERILGHSQVLEPLLFASNPVDSLKGEAQASLSDAVESVVLLSNYRNRRGAGGVGLVPDRRDCGVSVGILFYFKLFHAES